MIENKKTPQDVLDQGELKNVSYPCFDVLEIPITELINRKDEILDFLIKPVVDGHLIKNAECIRENHKYIFTIFYECHWLLKTQKGSHKRS